MKIAFCTTCKGRLEHLRQTLPRNLADNPSDAIFVVLGYGDAALARYIVREHSTDLRSGHLVYYHFDTRDRFRMSHAKNMAARAAIREGADILVTLDADNFAGPFAPIAASLKPGTFMCPDFARIKTMPHGPARPQRGYAGRLAIRAQDFVKMGGYDEAFDTWRGEDIDLIYRLERLGYKSRFIDNKYLGVLPHDASVRFREYPEAVKFENSKQVKVLASRTETVVNGGRFGLGRVRCNFAPGTTTFKPIPTRVFGIGLHKTATSSLHRAFELMGFDSLHWGTGEAPLIWQEMNVLGRSPTLERWYAISDLPIPLLYQKLDRAYPGSKFVLTVRDEGEWVKSVERLWDRRFNPTRWMWDVYPFSNTIHRELYGQTHFDANVFVERYRRHNTEVREYFNNRPGDLLEMNMSEGGGWGKLAPFLGVAPPSTVYPRDNVTRALPVEIGYDY